MHKKSFSIYERYGNGHDALHLISTFTQFQCGTLIYVLIADLFFYFLGGGETDPTKRCENPDTLVNKCIIWPLCSPTYMEGLIRLK